MRGEIESESASESANGVPVTVPRNLLSVALLLLYSRLHATVVLTSGGTTLSPLNSGHSLRVVSARVMF